MKVEEILKGINKYAPEDIACEWDNTGLQIGSMAAEIKKAVLCVDVTEYVVEEALQNGAEMIISHHPLLFHPLGSITDGTRGELIKKIIKNDINVYSSHTSFDASPYGINAYCAHKLGIKTDSFLEPFGEGYGIGVCGNLEVSMSAISLAEKVKDVFGAENVKISSYMKDKTLRRAAFCSGAGSGYINEAKKLGADILITSDCKNSDFIKAYENNTALLCITHFESEKCFIKLMKAILRREAPQLEITESEESDFELYIRQ